MKLSQKIQIFLFFIRLADEPFRSEDFVYAYGHHSSFQREVYFWFEIPAKEINLLTEKQSLPNEEDMK